MRWSIKTACSRSGSPQQRALLAMLLVHRGEPVSSDRLIEGLWGEQPPASGIKIIQGYVSNLRKVLGDGLLVTRGRGYQLAVGRDQVDVGRFEQRVAEGRGALERGDPARAAELLRAALALWRGPPLADFAYDAFARADAARLEEERLTALEDRIDADLLVGRHGSVVGELEVLVRGRQLRERLAGQLMLALYRGGRQAEALAAYQRVRAHLDEQLGLEPGPALKRLQTQILHHAPELDTRAATGDAGIHELALDSQSRQQGVMQANGEPVHAHAPLQPASEEVLWVPLPAAVSARLRESQLADRASELGRCAAASERVGAGEQRVVLVAGEPGIGKTRLAAELAGRLHAAGMTVLWGRCDRELGVPYQPFVEILTHYTRFAPRHVPLQHRARYGNELARLVPELAGPIGPPAAIAEQSREENRHVMFAAVGGILRSAALQRPLVLVLDDLQWADQPTLLLLKYLLLSSQPMRALIVGTYRSTEREQHDALNSLLADLRREPGVEWVELGGLPAEDVIEMAQDLAQERLEPAAVQLVRVLWEQTDGNPFFIGEIVRSLSEAGGVNRAARAHAVAEHAAVLVPAGIRETIAARVGRMAEPAERVLSAAAVIGTDFDVELLARTCDVGEEELVKVLDAAAAAALITEVPGIEMRFRFVHELIAFALYEQLGGARRRVLHARALEGLEQLLGEDARDRRIGELAHHALCGVPMVAAGKPVEYARLAGERALARLAPQEAMRWFDQALSSHERLEHEVTRGDAERLLCDLLIGRGIALEQSGDPDSRATLLQAGDLARRLGDGTRLVRAALATARPFSESGRVDDDWIEMLEAALATVEERDSASQATLLAHLAAELTFAGDWERRKRLSDESLAIARRLADPATLTAVLRARFVAIWTPETLEQRRADTELGLAIAEELDDPRELFRAVHWKAMAAVEAGELHHASELLDRQTELVDRLPLPSLRWIASYDRATHALMHGHLEDAERSAEDARQIGVQSGQLEAVAFYAGQLINIRFEQGRLAELEPLIDQQVQANPGIPAFRAALALARSEAGMTDGALDLLSLDATTDFSDLPYDTNWLVGITIYAQACATLADSDIAAKLYRLLEPWREHVAFNGATAWGIVGRHLGNLDRVLGRYSEAEQKLVSAAAKHERMDAPIWLARTQLDLARLLLERRRDTARAAELLQHANGTARELGCASIERQTIALLGDL